MGTSNTTLASLPPKKRGFLIAFVIMAFALLILAIIIPSGNKNQTKEDAQYIVGLDPVTVYLNLQKWGFSVDRDFSTYGNLWTCKYSAEGLDYTVTIYSPKAVDKAQSVLMSIMASPYSSISNGLQLACYFATTPYDTADIEKAKQFVESNYNNDKSSIIIGDAEFTIYAPTQFARMIDIQKVAPQIESGE
ncbi:MAG: hypothetical protein LIR35_02805 [Bacteroidota bacterium]|nr:hypothetical protein [Bacteroidota bacterium]